MNREIKFRGISKESGKFIYGLPKIIKDGFGDVAAVYICYFAKSFKLVEDEILFETLGECISQKDINNIDTYEGDIVKVYLLDINNNQFCKNFQVVFNKGQFCFKDDDFYIFDVFEVIGNIHYKTIEEIKTC